MILLNESITYVKGKFIYISFIINNIIDIFFFILHTINSIYSKLNYNSKINSTLEQG